MNDAAKSYADRALFTEQKVLAAGDLTADGTVAFTKTAFHVLDRWMMDYAVNCQLTFKDQVTVSQSDEVAPRPTRGPHEVMVLNSKVAETCRSCKGAFFRVVPAWLQP